MGLVIDTSALAAVERAAGSWDEALASLGDEPAALPAIVCAELLVGVDLAQGAARGEGRRAKIRALLSTVPIVDFTLEIAERWAELFTTLSRRRQLIPPTTWPWRPRRGTSGSVSLSARGTSATSAPCLVSASKC